jgi:hypothetical protein
MYNHTYKIICLLWVILKFKFFQDFKFSQWHICHWSCRLTMLLLLFWVVTPCRLIGSYLCFWETYCCCLQGWSPLQVHCVKTQNDNNCIVIPTVMRTSCLCSGLLCCVVFCAEVSLKHWHATKILHGATAENIIKTTPSVYVICCNLKYVCEWHSILCMFSGYMLNKHYRFLLFFILLACVRLFDGLFNSLKPNCSSVSHLL